MTQQFTAGTIEQKKQIFEMSWINNDDYPENKVYRTPSTEQKDIINDIEIVIEQSIKMKSEDGAGNSSTIMLYSNATNGYIGVYMYDLDEMTEVGNSSYLLELPELWEISLDHEEGSDYYDQITEESAKAFGETQKGIEIKRSHSIYFSNELDDMCEI